jgi:diacylglycerol kinase family enzyme
MGNMQRKSLRICRSIASRCLKVPSSAVFTPLTDEMAEPSVLAAASGDGIIHELINGLASREDAEDALKIPVVPIPTGEAIVAVL